MGETAYQLAMSTDEGVKRVKDLFIETFQTEPSGVWSAPGRVNLIGEHTDYNGGMALPIALPHRTFAAAKLRDDNLVRLISAQESGIRTADLDKVGPAGSEYEVPGWPAYVVGVAWAMEQTGRFGRRGFDIAVDSSVPYGAGLSSSAALEAAVAMALLDLLNEESVQAIEAGNPLPEWSDVQRAEAVGWCVQAENEIAGAPTGGMDQSAVLRCQADHALALDCRDNSVSQVVFDLDSLGMKLLVIDTKAPHSHVDGQYGQRRKSCEAAAQKLGVEYLADIEDLAQALDQLDDPIERQRVRHVVTEIERTKETISLLNQLNDLPKSSKGSPETTALMAQIGKLFTASHVSLRDDYQVTCPELDLVVDVALENGAVGARMTGGGFGGSAITLVQADQTHVVADAINTAFAAQGFNPPVFLVVEADAPANRDLVELSKSNETAM